MQEAEKDVNNNQPISHNLSLYQTLHYGMRVNLMSRSSYSQLASCLLKPIIAVPATFGWQRWKKLISPSLLPSMETRNCQDGNIS